MSCSYCHASCNAIWSPADNKAERFPTCDRLHAIYALNVPLIVNSWRQHVRND